ncbi:MAG: 2-phospho-L-lactate transferase [Candidatus Nephthysia bennettiae]|uniref:2-phospho-L-lactate transferase n=1 Tax=Candidatus Nephthysia bennettiae TaxID=3127016 RepID=A0A934N8Q6_9BACT|nr:2-phospho-L-lactate transferase [Candidatus Dormibacteraeota bacterium]PZS00253.1 MAG: 2-phospho-L-lactate transferase [Candidatus Dormibacteraeota bacterium]
MDSVVLLAGGTGAARLAVGLERELPAGALSVVTNTADDVDFWGLRVCPDTDAVLFRLAGIFNEEAGFGVRGETFNVHSQMGRLGEPGWFQLGDRDLAFHIVRTAMLTRGSRLTDTALELGRRLQVRSRILPMSDDDVRTCFDTDLGWLGFQEYFVRERLKPALRGLRFDGLGRAQPSPEVAEAIGAARLVLIGPSNPLISIGPITSLVGPLLDPDRTLAVSPLVGGRALKGPTAEMMRALRGEATALRVAEEYLPYARGFALDRVDSESAAAVEALGYRVLVTDTVMDGADGAQRLARALLDFALPPPRPAGGSEE